MLNKPSLFLISFMFSFVMLQAQIDHWENIVHANDLMLYWDKNADPGDGWMAYDYEDALWLEGRGGFGYGDNDDATIVKETTALYLRVRFYLYDMATIEKMVLHMDYDDGFVAYINGIEIARSGLTSEFPSYNEFAESHEATMYSGGKPEAFMVSDEILQNSVHEGENILAVQIHNQSLTSSDLSALVFLSAAINSTTFEYRELPDWFVAPFVFSSSYLPIVLINTDGQIIQDEDRITSEMKIIMNEEGMINSVRDTSYDYHGLIGIELKGNSSAKIFPKKSYRFETRDSTGEDINVKLMGFPKENDWILHAPYTDKTFVKNVLTYHLSNKMGHYASRTKYCEVVLNGEYQGLYVLMETIKRDDDRVDIKKLKATDLVGDSVTGGYIFKSDWPESHTWYTTKKSRFEYVYPKPDNIMPQQGAYLKQYLDEFETMMSGPEISNALNGYPAYIDVNSFVDFILITELSKHQDSYFLSAYYHKNQDSRGGKLVAGPLWDFNLSYGNTTIRDCSIPEKWNIEAYSKGGDHPTAEDLMHFWWLELWKDKSFQDSINVRWWELRKTILNEAYLFSFLDSTKSVIENAALRNFNRWPIIGEYVWPNSFVGHTWDEEYNYTRDWISQRLAWMDDALGDPIVDTKVQSFGLSEKRLRSYPNPYKENTTFTFFLKRSEKLEIRIRDIQGSLVQILMLENARQGKNTLHWDGTDANGNELPPGFYFGTLSTEDENESIKLLKIK